MSDMAAGAADEVAKSSEARVEHAAAEPRFRWEEADGRTLTPTACSVGYAQDEIALLFGIAEEGEPQRQDVCVRWSIRIILSPSVAKGVATALHRVICDREARLSPWDSDPSPATRRVTAANPPSSFSEPRKATELSARFLQVVNTLHVPLDSEWSFKMVPARILRDRFLTWVSKNSLANAEQRILGVCAGLGMPENLLELFKRRLPDTNFIHFGFEADESGCLYKVYLEFLEQVRKEIDNNQENRTPVLLHLAFKWDATDKSRQAVTRYTLYPWLTVSEMVSRTAGMLTATTEGGGAAGAVEEIVRLASGRIPPHNLLYLEVTEEGNPRRSFDINMYRAALKVAELHSFLGTIARQLAVPERDFRDLYEAIKTQRFGHLAGGVSRDGREFFTVYYGASRFREIEPEAAAPAATAVPPLVPRPPAQKMRIPGEDSAYIMKLIQDLGVRFGVERSVKMCEHNLLSGGLLLPFRRSPEPDQDERIMAVCRRLNMPPDFLEALRGSLPRANILLFGCEGDPANSLYNADLEFSQKLGEVASGEPEKSQPFLIQMGFQWDARGPSRKKRRDYTCFPSLPIEQIVSRLAGRFYAPAMRPPGRIVQDMVSVAGGRSGARLLLYCEAQEGENPSSAFDVNAYRANLRIKDMYPALLAIARHYSVPLDGFQTIYEEISELVFGHLTGGVDLEGREFVTVYFSQKGSAG